MGWMLWTKYLHPKQSVQFERDDGYRDDDAFADVAFYPYKKFYHIERRCLSQMDGLTVLDAGTGAGRASLYFQNRRRAAIAVDISPGAVSLAKTRGVLEVHQMSVLDLTANDARWEAIIMIGNGTTVARSLKELGLMLEHLRKISRPGTQLVITSLDIHDAAPEHHLRYQQAQSAKGHYAGDFSLRYHIGSQTSGWLSGVLVDPSTLYGLLEDTGWHVRARFQHPLELPLYGMIAN